MHHKPEPPAAPRTLARMTRIILAPPAELRAPAKCEGVAGDRYIAHRPIAGDWGERDATLRDAALVGLGERWGGQGEKRKREEGRLMQRRQHQTWPARTTILRMDGTAAPRRIGQAPALR